LPKYGDWKDGGLTRRKGVRFPLGGCELLEEEKRKRSRTETTLHRGRTYKGGKREQKKKRDTNTPITQAGERKRKQN